MKHNFLRLDGLHRTWVGKDNGRVKDFVMISDNFLKWNRNVWWIDGVKKFFSDNVSDPWRSCFRSSHLCVVTEVWPVSWGVLKSCFWFTIQHLRRSMRSSSHQDLVLSSLLEKGIYISNCSVTWRIWLGKHVYKT